MPFWDHIDELRSRFIKSIFSVVIFTAIAYMFSDKVLFILSQPKIEIMNHINLQVLKITSMFMIKIYISLILGVALSLPVILYQFWKFVSPAINEGFGFHTFFLFFLSTVFFFIGAYFSYSTIIPISIEFFI